MTQTTTRQETKQDKLWRWCQERRVFSSSDVHVYGIQNYHTGATRVVREFVLCEMLRRIPPEEAVLRGLRRNKGPKITFYEVA